ncbi:phosphate regulon sensor histidine kinase PhoR [Neisseria perflava]|uniref:phosphate regulon sensor histidine kinase PhoR n=1 Tax=Neisseria perflava TaxID=33053 RepID=UPI00209DC1A3|nr:phosphate regulon sensor histidine kinase PhoR [Neisseria perflava]MCP1659474.1 two-component system phosphate regulon sensor histidine kinase PhoR [Neisseria perflava]MCP1772313.1 two-component system phosphate regulon sensor histidine kinase PhoR [Neisseria perflava]
MNKLSYLIPPLLGILFCAAAGYVFYGITGALAAALAVTLLIALLHFRQLYKLLNWLSDPEPETVPFAAGIWDEVFSTLLAQSRTRRKQKRKLRKALTRFNRAAESLPTGVMILDRDNRIEWQNRLSANHFNLQREQDKGSIVLNLIRLPEFHAFMAQTEYDQIRLAVPQNHPIPRTLLITRCPFEKNTRMIISQDVSTIEQIQSSQTHFVANVSHELRTPLTVINGFLETLQDMPDLPLEQRQQFIGLMRQEGSRMLDLLNDLLTLSKLEGSHHQAQDKTAVNLSLLAQQLADDTRRLSDGRHDVSTDIAPDIVIQGIEPVLYSALSNLAFNAVRYTPEGGTVHIALTREGGHRARFSVTDSGPGIAAEHIPHLTERFYRADAGRNRSSGGTGLGLAIAKHALAVHGTKIDVTSEVGKGSEFAVGFETE